ncbi:O-antigen ligase family protein [Peribacillus frigoritolerans]|uniref:O-antigen ligase family protein n=1 Tax=Peribacillus frigoritolerans TaxID=450367 RepID=UPI0033057047
MVNKIGLSNYREIILCIIGLLYAIGASVYHPIILVSLVFLVYFFVNQKLLYLYTIPFFCLYLIFIPFGSANFNVCYALLVFLGCLSFIFSFKTHIKQKATWIFILYFLGISAGLLYAPDIRLGIHLTLLNFIAFMTILVGQQIANNYSVEIILKNIILLGLPIGVLNVIFLLLPDLEISFLQSSLASLFIDSGALSVLFGEGYNNILDPRKAGTFFVNTNVAAVFFGMLFWTSISLRLKSTRRYYNVIIIIYFLALISTNSRAGIGAIAFTILILILINIKKKKTWVRIILLSFPVLLLGIIFANTGLFSNVVDRLSINAIQSDPRMEIWRFALSHIHPIFGLGYGGWEQISFQMGESLSKLPPHNNFLIVWSWSGILGVFSLALLMFGVLFISVKRYVNTKNPIYIALIGSYATVLFQGMFDNYFLHNYRISTLLFMITGLILFTKNKEKKP